MAAALIYMNGILFQRRIFMRIDFSGKFYTITTKIADVIILDLLVLLCCIPIVTIGASLTAGYYVAMKMSQNHESYIFSSFFKSFRQNFRQSTIIWLILLALAAVLFLDFRIVLTQNSGIFRVFVYLLGCVALLLAFVFLYVFPVLAKFYNTIRQTFRNAFLMALRHLPYTIAMLFISALPFTILFLNVSLALRVLPLYLLLGFSLPIYLNSYFFNKIFENYIPQDG